MGSRGLCMAAPPMHTGPRACPIALARVTLPSHWTHPPHLSHPHPVAGSLLPLCSSLLPVSSLSATFRSLLLLLYTLHTHGIHRRSSTARQSPSSPTSASTRWPRPRKRSATRPSEPAPKGAPAPPWGRLDPPRTRPGPALDPPLAARPVRCSSTWPHPLACALPSACPSPPAWPTLPGPRPPGHPPGPPAAHRNMPIGILGSVSIVTFIYMLMCVVLNLMVPREDIDQGE